MDLININIGEERKRLFKTKAAGIDATMTELFILAIDIILETDNKELESVVIEKRDNNKHIPLEVKKK